MITKRDRSLLRIAIFRRIHVLTFYIPLGLKLYISLQHVAIWIFYRRKLQYNQMARASKRHFFFQPQKRSKALDLSEPVQQGKTKQQMAYFLA